jgi:hypothetical protein
MNLSEKLGSEQPCSRLNSNHQTEIVEGSGVSLKIAQLNFWSVINLLEVNQILNRNSKGRTLVPGWAVTGINPRTGERWHQGVQYKPDTPIKIGGKPQKYLSASSTETQPLFLDTGDSSYWTTVRGTASTPIYVTEGAKKSACLLSLGYFPAGGLERTNPGAAQTGDR